MKGVCSISRKKLIKGLIAVPIAVLALLYGSGYLSQLLYNYERWQAAGESTGLPLIFQIPTSSCALQQPFTFLTVFMVLASAWGFLPC